MKDHHHSAPPEGGANRLGRILWITGLALVYALPLVTLRGAVDMFLKIDGIDGESEDAKHKGEIDVLAWSWGMSQSGTSHAGGGGGAGKANFQDLSVTKFIDKSSPDLMLHCANGKHIDKAVLTVRKAGGTQPEEYLIITMKNVLISSYQTGGDAGDPVEDRVNFSYTDYIQRVFTFDPAGTETGEFEVFWNIPTNTGGGSGLVTNDAPTITAISDQLTSEDGTPVVVSFVIDDAETPAGALILGRSSGNQVLVPNANIVFGGSGANRTATITPVPDGFGTSSIVVSVSDGSMSASANFNLEVTPVNDPPSVGALSGQVTDQDVSIDVPVTLSDVDDDPAALLLIADSSNPALLPAANITVPAAGNPRVLTLNPAPGQSGETVITLTAEDDEGLTSPPVDFLLTVNALGNGIDFIALNGQPSPVPALIPEDSPNGFVVGILETSPPDPAVTFSLADDAGGRFGIDASNPGAVNLVVANANLLDFETGPSHTVIIQATKPMPPADSTRSEVFRIDLTNVNEAPLLTLPGDYGTAPPDVLWSLDGVSIADPDSGPNDIVVTVSVGNGTLFVDNTSAPGVAVSGHGTPSVTLTGTLAELNTLLGTFAGLTYRSGAAFAGTETINVTSDDQGHTGPGGTLTDAASTTIEIALTAWQEWRILHFTAAELADLDISGFSADADSDGLPNGGEFGLGSDPKDPADGPARVQIVFVDVGGVRYPALTFPRRISDPELTITAEVATNLLNWSSGQAFTAEESATPIDPDFDQPVIRSLWDVPPNPTQQLRLRFSLDPR